MEQKPELRLPTTAVPVTLRLVAGQRVEAELFLADGTRTGHSKLLDDVATLLDEPTAFLPVRVQKQVQLYAKPALLYVSIARHPEEDDDEEFEDVPSEVITLYDRQHHVTIDLARVIDHLNRRGRFLRLWTEATHYLINKDQIIRVTEQEA
jgi:hypothetical protein